MFFNSLQFIAFFAIVYVAVLIMRVCGSNTAARNVLLLLASYWFYGSFNLGFTLLLLFVTAVCYAGGLLILRDTSQTESASKRRKIIVGVTTATALLPLVFFKYARFLCQSFGSLLNAELNIELLEGLMLPVGISFFTFQALSYVIDAYRGKITERPSALDFALFVSFFPTILSGPIEKARELLPQLKARIFPTSGDFAQGASIFIWGLFKKVVVADRLAGYVDWAYFSSGWVSGSTLAVAAVFYSIQIYCDFSGYSDMALGVARALGFRVTKNFRQPYFAHTFKEFWRRWHIALTSWFTEYVYFSLGGSRVKSKIRWIFNISTIFILSGIWHGAAWNFLIWGVLHAVFYMVEHAIGLQRKAIRWNCIGKIAWGIVVFIGVTTAWIFFRIGTFEGAVSVVAKIFTDFVGPFSYGSSAFSFGACLIMMAVLLLYELIILRGWLTFDTEGYEKRLTANVLSIVPLLLLICMFGVSSDNFVYFQF